MTKEFEEKSKQKVNHVDEEHCNFNSVKSRD